MKTVTRHFDAGTIAVIAITLALFGIALLEKGLTRDLLLETGIFLVSVKLIILGYKNSVSAETIARELKQIQELLKKEITRGKE
jgi:uncharacterized membrane protein YbhN (UPF0104 family)